MSRHEPWFSLHPEESPVPGEIRAGAKVSADSPFFSGHFPKNPVLPGVAMLAMAASVLDQPPAGSRRVRFRRTLQTGGDFAIRVKPIEGTTDLRFEIGFEDQTVCNGTLLTRHEEIAQPADEPFPAPVPGDYPVEDYIPHRDRMRLVSEILRVSEGHCVARSEVLDTWPLCHQGSVPTLVLIELIAQSAACLVGWERRHEEKMGGRGLLVGVKQSWLGSPDVPAGTLLTSGVETELKHDNYVVFRGLVRSDAGPVAEARIQAFRP